MTTQKKIVLLVLSVLVLVIFIAVLYGTYSNNQVSTTTETKTVLRNDDDKKQKGENPPVNNVPKVDSSIEYSLYSICLENTKDGPDAKDCCDCLDADLSVRKACRDATVRYDFSKNTIFKSFEIPSTLGINGDYSSYTISGNQEECKQACEATTTTLSCGDFRFCRTACDALPE